MLVAIGCSDMASAVGVGCLLSHGRERLSTCHRDVSRPDASLF
jgi:hypothetical protein